MNKRSKITVGLLALIAAFGLILTGCPDPNNDSSSSGNNNPPPKVDIVQTIPATAAVADNFLKLVVDGGDFASSARVYFNNEGTKILVTTGAPPAGYNGPVSVTSFDTGKLASTAVVPVVAATPTAGQLKAAVPIEVTVKTNAYTVSVGEFRTGIAKPVVIGNGTFSFAAGTDGAATANNTIVYTPGSPAKLSYKLSAGAVTGNLDQDFDEGLIADLTALKSVLFASNTAVGTFTVASGAITEIATTAAATVPATTNLFVPGAALKLHNAAFTVNGSVTAGTALNNVTFKKAVITPTAATFVTTAGAATLAATGTIALKDGGSIETAGTGSLVVGKTTFDGVGAWTATLGSGATSITITSSTNGAILSLAGTPAASTLTASGTNPTITQTSGASNVLAIGANVTIALGCTVATGTTVGSIKVIEINSSNGGGTISFADATSVILIDAVEAPGDTAMNAAAGKFKLAANKGAGIFTVSAFDNVLIYPGSVTTGKAVKINGGAAAGTLQAHDAGTGSDPSINGSAATTG
jgi:acetyltransferase-like isoleucine patch superfamily enzyme